MVEMWVAFLKWGGGTQEAACGCCQKEETAVNVLAKGCVRVRGTFSFLTLLVRRMGADGHLAPPSGVVGCDSMTSASQHPAC